MKKNSNSPFCRQSKAIALCVKNGRTEEAQKAQDDAVRNAEKGTGCVGDEVPLTFCEVILVPRVQFDQSSCTKDGLKGTIRCIASGYQCGFNCTSACVPKEGDGKVGALKQPAGPPKAPVLKGILKGEKGAYNASVIPGKRVVWTRDSLPDLEVEFETDSEGSPTGRYTLSFDGQLIGEPRYSSKLTQAILESLGSSGSRQQSGQQLSGLPSSGGALRQVGGQQAPQRTGSAPTGVPGTGGAVQQGGGGQLIGGGRGLFKRSEALLAYSLRPAQREPPLSRLRFSCFYAKYGL